MTTADTRRGFSIISIHKIGLNLACRRKNFHVVKPRGTVLFLAPCWSSTFAQDHRNSTASLYDRHDRQHVAWLEWEFDVYYEL